MIQRVINPYMAYMLMPWYIDTWEPIADVCTRVFSMLFENPQETFVAAELNDDESIKGIVIASKNGEDVEIAQMNGVDAKGVEEKLSEWGKSIGCTRFKIRTNRNPEAFEKRHGFKLEETEEINGIETHTMSRSI